MLIEVITGTLVAAIVRTGGWIATEIQSPHGKRARQDADIAEWFDTYELSAAPPRDIDVPMGVSETEFEQTIQSNEVQAVLHELLAARITGAPEADVSRVRVAFYSAIASSRTSSQPDSISTRLFDYYDSEVCCLVGRLAGAQPDLFAQLRHHAFSARIVAVLNRIQTHVESLNNRDDYQEEISYIANYHRHVRDLHGKLQPPDSERRQRIPIKDIYVSPNIVPVANFEIANPGQGTVTRQQEHQENLDDADLLPASAISLPDLSKSLDRTVLLGDPGGGKSTAANVLMYSHALDHSGRVPFLVVLRDFASEGSPSLSVLAFIEHKLDALYQCPAPNGLVRRLLLSGRALVIFDGLDELIDATRRTEITDIVEQFCAEYPLTAVLVTSRIVGYNQARLDDRQFVCFRLAGFSAGQTRQYVQKWFAQDSSIEPTVASQWAQSFLDESAGVPDLRSNPLLLALMCILYHGQGSIPRNRPEVYEQCAELLFRKWDTRRRIKVELRASNLVEPALRHLAYWLFTRNMGHPAVTERELVGETAAFLRNRGFESEDDAIDASRQFVQFCRGRAWVFSDAGATGDGDTLYTFTHRTFLEYFAAAYLAINSDTPEMLAKALLPHVAKQEWDVVAELAIQKKEQINERGAERVINAMLNDRRKRNARGRSNVLQFLMRCLRSIEVPPRLAREMTRRALSFLFSGDPATDVYYLPLAYALTWPPGCREIAGDEIAERATRMIASSDRSVHLMGLRLATYIDGGTYGLQGALQRSSRDYWEDFARTARTTCADAVMDAIDEDPAMLRLALESELITVRDLATRRKGDVTALFEEVKIGIFNVSWRAYLPRCLTMVLEQPNAAESDRYMRALTGIGQYIRDSSPLFPWVRHVEDPFDRAIRAEQRKPGVSFDPVALMGAVTIICTLLEMAGRSGRRDLSSWSNAFPDLGPYFARRWFADDRAVLTDLAVPSEFVMLFKDWSAGKMSFVAGSDSPKEGKGGRPRYGRPRYSDLSLRFTGCSLLVDDFDSRVRADGRLIAAVVSSGHPSDWRQSEPSKVTVRVPEGHQQ